MKLNGFYDLFFEKQIINLENHTNCNSECIAKHSACVRTNVKTKQNWDENKCRFGYLETNFTSTRNL